MAKKDKKNKNADYWDEDFEEDQPQSVEFGTPAEESGVPLQNEPEVEPVAIPEQEPEVVAPIIKTKKEKERERKERERQRKKEEAAKRKAEAEAEGEVDQVTNDLNNV